VTPCAPPNPVLFPARIVASTGPSRYTIREQSLCGDEWIDAPGAIDVPAENGAEDHATKRGCSNKPLRVGTFILVTPAVRRGPPDTIFYLFDHPLRRDES
jgi:hypothetical protein